MLLQIGKQTKNRIMKRLMFFLVITLCSLVAKGYNYIDVTKTGKGENLIIITGVGGNIL